MTDVPASTNKDGRYYWTGNANGVTGGQITFVGDPAALTGTSRLTWTIMQRANDGSYPIVTYSTDNGVTPHSTRVGSEGTPQEVINESGAIDVSLNSALGYTVNVTSGGGTATAGATPWIIAIAITRNNNESLPWDFPNPYDPVAYNGQRMDNQNGTVSDTLGNLRKRILIRLGFSNQASNPPPGMAALVNDFLFDAQATLYRDYLALHTRRLFRWKIIPGQRFYSLLDNDEDILAGYHLDPTKTIEWVGIQDTRNVWYPVIEGIPPSLYTMLTKPWRPARYSIRQCLEIYPAPDQTYWLWISGNLGLGSFANDSDQTTIDSNLVFLHALANAKAHYGQPDANNMQARANAYRGRLIAGTHATGHYIPGTTAVPPAVRPTLIQYSDGTGS